MNKKTREGITLSLALIITSIFAFMPMPTEATSDLDPVTALILLRLLVAEFCFGLICLAMRQ